MAGSVGQVEGDLFEYKGKFRFVSGGELEQLTIAYETYGELNKARDNAILVCHALSGHQHAAGERGDEPSGTGWWDLMIGPGKPIDTGKFFVISVNNLGGCHGSTGPSSINSASGKAYGPDFPEVRVEDWVEAQKLLADHFSIASFHAVVGGSIGGMQALSWAIRHPRMVRRAVIIAGTPKLNSQNIAFNEIARQSIMRDPNFADGDFYAASPPKRGLAVARMLGHITYLSGADLEDKFGRERKEDRKTFEIESYLRYNGDKFAEKFDANTYLIMTRALDAFDPAESTDGDLTKALAPALARFLVVSFKQDWRFPCSRSRELVKAALDAGKQVSYGELKAAGGHDAFLKDDPTYHSMVGSFLATPIEKQQ